MARGTVLLLVAGALLAGCGAGASTEEPFAYDGDQPLAVEEGERLPASAQVVVRSLGFASGEDTVEGYLIAPRAAHGRRPAVVLLHGAGGDREEQLAQAVALAQRGALALTLTAPSRRKQPPADAAPEDALRWQRDTIVADVVATRRGLDLLAADERVDDTRLGLVGWSMGGRLAAIVAAVDERVRATVLISAGALPVAEYVAAAPDELRDDVEEVLPAIDPLAHVAAVRGALFVQAGRSDAVVPERALRRLAAAAPEGTRVRWYAADHALDERARRERLDWLARELRLG
jgi:dienelactone hydrolase